MKVKDIYNSIRKIYIRNILWPLAAIIIPLGLLYFLPFEKVLKPKVVKTTEEAIDAIENGYEYLEIDIQRLIYSGYDYMRDEDVYGQYFYDLVGSKECLFYLLEPEGGVNKETYIYDVNRMVKVEEGNGIYKNMLSMFANSINWTEDGVKDITKEYVLSEVNYHYRVYLYIYIMLIAFMLYGVGLLIYSIVIIAFPVACPRIIIARNLLKSGHHSSLGQFMKLVEREINDPVLNIGSMYVTKHFIINIDTKDFDLVPIDRIIIAYEHSTLKSFLGMHLKVTHTIYLKCTKIFRFHIPKKTLEEANAILDYLRVNKPDTLIGYTKENKELVKEIVNSTK